jgi:hypothetical protein
LTVEPRLARPLDGPVGLQPWAGDFLGSNTFDVLVMIRDIRGVYEPCECKVRVKFLPGLAVSTARSNALSRPVPTSCALAIDLSRHYNYRLQTACPRTLVSLLTLTSSEHSNLHRSESLRRV